MVEVAALTESGEIVVRVVRGVLIQMGAREMDDGFAKQVLLGELGRLGQTLADEATPSVAQATAILVEPTAVAKMDDGFAVRSVAAFAAPLGANEPDLMRQL